MLEKLKNRTVLDVKHNNLTGLSLISPSKPQKKSKYQNHTLLNMDMFSSPFIQDLREGSKKKRPPVKLNLMNNSNNTNTFNDNLSKLLNSNSNIVDMNKANHHSIKKSKKGNKLVKMKSSDPNLNHHGSNSRVVSPVAINKMYSPQRERSKMKMSSEFQTDKQSPSQGSRPNVTQNKNFYGNANEPRDDVVVFKPIADPECEESHSERVRIKEKNFKLDLKKINSGESSNNEANEVQIEMDGNQLNELPEVEDSCKSEDLGDIKRLEELQPKVIKEEISEDRKRKPKRKNYYCFPFCF